MKRILYVIGQLGIGGAEKQLLILAGNLDRTKYTPLICVFLPDSKIHPLVSRYDLDVIYFPKQKSPDLTRLFKLIKISKEFKPDIIHSYLFVANTWSRIVGFLLKIPVVLSERSSNPNKPIFIDLINRFLSSLGSILICNSISGAKRVLEKKEFPPDRVKVIYNGIDFTQYNGLTGTDNKDILSDLPINTNSKVVGMIANFTEAKNHELLFDSLSLILPRFSDVCVLCVGDGPRFEKMQNYVKSLGIQDKVFFVGSQENIRKYLTIMDLFVLPSKWEGLPNVLMEAMASLCPVIATDVGGVRELIKDGETGFLVSPDDKFELADKIIFALTHKNKVDRISKKAFQFITDQFSIDRMVMETEMVYELVLEGDQPS